jgi:monoamine oxidase
VRLTITLDQLVELIGEEAGFPVLYQDKIWDNEFITAGKQVIESPHQNNGHPVFKIGYLNDKLFFAELKR